MFFVNDKEEQVAGVGEDLGTIVATTAVAAATAAVAT